MKNKKYFAKKNRVKIIVAVVILITIIYAAFFAKNFLDSNSRKTVKIAEVPSSQKMECKTIPPEQDPELLSRLRSIVKDENILKEIVLSYDDNVSGDSDGSEGFVMSEDTCGKQIGVYQSIKIKTNAPDSTLAHEYIHVIEAELRKDNSADWAKIKNLVMTRYNNDSAFRNFLNENYSQAVSSNYDEQFAYYCAQFSDEHIGSEILSWCNKYINRGAYTRPSNFD